MARVFHDLFDYEDIIAHIEAWFRLKSLHTVVKHKVVGDTKMNDLIQVKFTPDYVQHLWDCDVVVIINPELYEELSVEQDTLDILINEALDVIGYKDDKVVKLKQDYQTSLEYQNKVGVDNLIKAKEIKKLKIESYKDAKKNNK